MLRLMNKKDSGLFGEPDLETKNNFENSSNVNDMHKKWYSSQVRFKQIVVAIKHALM